MSRVESDRVCVCLWVSVCLSVCFVKLLLMNLHVRSQYCTSEEEKFTNYKCDRFLSFLLSEFSFCFGAKFVWPQMFWGRFYQMTRWWRRQQQQQQLLLTNEHGNACEQEWNWNVPRSFAAHCTFDIILVRCGLHFLYSNQPMCIAYARMLVDRSIVCLWILIRCACAPVPQMFQYNEQQIN